MKIPCMNALLLLVLLVMLGACGKDDDNGSNNPPEEEWPSDSIRVLKDNLQYPWEILWGRDNFLWVTERDGRVTKLNPKTGEVAFITTINDVDSRGEGGLLGMVHHPDFLQNGYLYVVYNYSSSDGYREKLVRLTYNNSALVDPQVILDNIPASNIHNGSRLWITDEVHPRLFMTTGDASNQPSAQDVSSPSGKVLRFNLDGTIPADNPIAGSPVWSLGHRNPQGLVVAHEKMYASEHGPNIEDEVNIIEKGRNYGWPSVNGPCTGSEVDFCNANNVKEPIWSSGSSTVAVCGMDYYNNPRIAVWSNSLLMTTLKDETLYRHQLTADGSGIVSTTTYFRGRWGRLRDVCVSPAGRVYICTSNGGNDDVIVEISAPE